MASGLAMLRHLFTRRCLLKASWSSGILPQNCNAGWVTNARTFKHSRSFVTSVHRLREIHPKETVGETQMMPPVNSEMEAEVDSEMEAEVDSEKEAEVDSEKEAEVDSEVKAEVDSEKEAEVDSEKEAENILANLDPVQAKKLKVLQLEVQMHQHYGSKVPEHVHPSWWVRLLGIETSSGRKKYYSYLFKTEKKKQSHQRKQLIKAEERAQRREMAQEREMDPSDRNTIFLRYFEKSRVEMVLNKKLVNAMMFGQELIIDMGFDNMMQTRECKNLADQLNYSFAANKQSQEPFHFIFTNVDPNGKTISSMRRLLGDRSFNNILITMTEKSYLDLYPREKLVYLTPNARQELREFSHDDVYIIGGLVDKSKPAPVALAKAKEQNIRIAKFPLDKYLVWCQGTKSLTVDQSVKILLDLKDTNCWDTALKHVPTRKLLKPSWT